MNFYPTFSPCPETHKPEDGIEDLIRRARHRLCSGIEPEEIMIELTGDDAPASAVFFAIVAAQLMP